jgi:DNA-directed RNA polymerase subunit RPC12/RpoP
MYCTQCGKEISDTATFCPFCGHKMMTMKEFEAFQTLRKTRTPKGKRFGVDISKW